MNIENIKIRGALDGLRVEMDERMEEIMTISSRYVGKQVNTPEYGTALSKIEQLLREIRHLRLEYLGTEPKVHS